MNRLEDLTKSAVHLTIILLFLVSAVSARDLFPRRCNHRNRACFKDKTVVPNLYVYSADDLRQYLRHVNADYSLKLVWKVCRNASGTAIYVKESSGETDYVISSGGNVKAIHRSKAYTIMDEQGKLRIIEFKQDPKAGRPTFVLGSYGDFFITGPSNEEFVEIRRIADPHKPLITASMHGVTIFSLGDEVYLFGNDKASYRKNGDIRDVVCQVFKRTGTGLELESEIRIPSWCHVIDVDPLTKNVVLQEDRDPPFTSIFRLFNLTTRRMAKIYLSDYSGYPIFLQEDILRIAK
jgi:hypothetical protein